MAAETVKETLKALLTTWRLKASDCQPRVGDTRDGHILTLDSLFASALLICADQLEEALALGERQETDEPLTLMTSKDARMGHVRLDECSDAAETQGKPLYERITAKLQKLDNAREEERQMRIAVGHEMDILRGRANAAEARQAAAEYRAQRIVLDAELVAEVARLKAALAAHREGPATADLPDCLDQAREIIGSMGGLFDDFAVQEPESLDDCTADIARALARAYANGKADALSAHREGRPPAAEKVKDDLSR